MKMKIVARVALGMLLLSGSNAFATVVYCPASPVAAGTNYQANLGPADNCRYKDGNVTAADINLASWWGPGWTERQQLLAAGSGAYLTATVDPSWGNPPMTGTWQLTQAFWETFGEAVISFHIGGGQGTPSGFAFYITKNSFSGTWGIDELAAAAGGGMSNIKLFSRGTGDCCERDVPEPGTLGLLGLGLLGISLGRRRFLTK